MKKTKKTILITGAASGIGLGLATGLAQAGHRVILNDLDLSRTREAADRIKRSGGDAIPTVFDVCCGEAVEKAVQALPYPIDVLINNAGLQHVSRLETFPQEKWDELIKVMLIGVCNVTRAVLPAMRERGYGRILNIGSIHSIVASPYKSAYVAAKHGLLGFSKTIALETSDRDITINTICPSYVKTPLVEKQIARQAAEHGISEEKVIDEIMLKPMPKSVFIEMDELAGIASFLISAAARNITGQAIVVDGGWTIQ